jgi:nucleoside-diphosphate-sugar epimerase
MPSVLKSPTKKLMVTGANGFFGSEIVRQGLEAGLHVSTSDRHPDSLICGVDYAQADVLLPPVWLTVLASIDVVIHAAGLAHVFDKSMNNAAFFNAINEIGTVNVARAAAQAGVRHFVLISSVSVYGGSRNGGAEDSSCYPQGPYAESKYKGEQRAIEIAEASGMALTILRLATLFGEGDPGNVSRLMRSIDRGHFVWIGDGTNRKSLLHREDAARACLMVAQRPASGVQVYNVAAPPCLMRDVVKIISDGLGRPLWPVHVPASIALGLTGLGARLMPAYLNQLQVTVNKWLADDFYDASKFEQTVAFSPRVSLKDGLMRQVAWYRDMHPKA